MNYQLHEIVNQGEINYELLQSEGISNTEELLSQAGKIESRKKLLEKTGMEEEDLLPFIYSADLLRIKGIGKQYVNLLCQADICTIEDLADWNGTTLSEHLEAINEKHQVVQNLPSEDQLIDFIEQARQLPNAVEEEENFENHLMNWATANQKGMTAMILGVLGLLVLGACYFLLKRVRLTKLSRSFFNMIKGIGKTAFLGWIMQKIVGTKNRLQKNTPSWLDGKEVSEKLEDLQNKVVNTIHR